MNLVEIPSACEHCIWGSGALLTYITWFISVVLWGVLIWFIKRGFINFDISISNIIKDINVRFDKVEQRFDKIEHKQDEQKDLYHLCRTDLPRVFASRETLKELINRVSHNEKVISGITADLGNIHNKINGNKK